MKTIQSITSSLGIAMAMCATAMAQDAAPTAATLITNARIFDGQNEKLADGMSVLVEGNMIAKIAKSITAPTGASVINADGKALMPGLIDAHWHVMFSEPTMPELLNSDVGWLTLLVARGAEDILLRGFTTVLRLARENNIPLMQAVSMTSYNYAKPLGDLA